MAKIGLELIQQLRQRTGIGMLDCRKALEESGGDIEEAIKILRKKGAAIAQARAGKETAQGIIHAYIHPGGRVGVLIEVNCETDFVARTADFVQFASDIAMHIAALKPLYLSPETVDPIFLEREKEIIKAQLMDSGKPEKIINQIAEGKISKVYEEVCLLKQSFVKNDQLNVEDVLKELIAKTGENIKIARFARYEIGS